MSASLFGAMQGVGAIWMAIVATRALSTWQNQMRAQKQIEFIDILIDATHDYLLQMSSAIGLLEVAKIGIDSYRGLSLDRQQRENAAEIAYIEADGPEYSKRIWEHLEPIRPIVAKIQSLSVKGQVLGFSEYEKCLNACRMLIWSHGEIDTFAGIIANRKMNWDHPRIQGLLSYLSQIHPEEIRANLANQNKVVLSFAQSAYESALR